MKVLFIGLLLSNLMAQDQNTEAQRCKARLEATPEAGFITITGYCQNLLSEPRHYRYSLVLAKQGSGGQSSNRQEGAFDVAPNQTVRLSQVRIGASATTRISGQLRITDSAGHVVAHDSI